MKRVLFYFSILLFILVRNTSHAACNDNSSLDNISAVTESECIQRINENCVWAPDSLQNPTTYSCEPCDTNPSNNPESSMTPSECFTTYSSDIEKAVICVAKQSGSNLSLVDFCFNSNHGRWKIDSKIFEDREETAADNDANDVGLEGLYRELKVARSSNGNSSETTPILISEIGFF